MSDFRLYLQGKGSTTAYALMTAVLAFVPEEFFVCGIIPCGWSKMTIIIFNRLFVFALILVICDAIYLCHRKKRRSVAISDTATTIKIEYGDICNITDGKKVINFDECFTTTVSSRPEDIKPESVCGQYLTKYPIDDIQTLIDKTGIKPKGHSLYGNKERYEHGVLIPRDDYFLMAFAKLDKDGRGFHTYESYLDCLDKLWEQIDLYHGTDDVYLPILGSKITRFDKDLNQQELLDIMIASFRLHPKKLKKPNALHIVCKEREDFSINKVFGVN